MKFRNWAQDAGLRAIKTAAQTAVGLLVVDQAGVIHADLKAVGYAAAAAAAASVLQNLANLRVPEQPVVIVHRHENARDADV